MPRAGLLPVTPSRFVSGLYFFPDEVQRRSFLLRARFIPGQEGGGTAPTEYCPPR